ncbi:S41 family peptidase [Komagataeibacter rhaeticus]|nr:S41 family peptidase [Komagataeibacter rhaeticus]
MSQYLDEAMNVPGLSGLVIDLRGNRGGVLQQAVTTSALMLDHGVAAITQGVTRRPTMSGPCRVAT